MNQFVLPGSIVEKTSMHLHLYYAIN